jgi:hypothetical protein
LNQLPPESYDRALQSVESQESAETWKHAVRRVRIEDMQARNRGGLDTPRSVTVTMRREYSATIEIRAESQAAADRAALRRFEKWACDEGCQALPLGFPPPWKEHDSIDSDPEIDTRFRCVDCGKDTQGGEYYMVSDAAWAASGMESHGGMLCLADLERRIGRELTAQDFTCMWPSLEAWKRHLASRSANPTEPESPEQLLLEFASAGRAAS